MAHDVFISYSTQDKSIADAVCAKLEGKKIRCWIAPRDVPPGQPFASSLINAINNSKLMVLILSSGSNQSQHVLREVGEAVESGIPIIPLRIEDVEPTEEMRYYIKTLHWLDAMSPPIERHLAKLTETVQAMLSVGVERQTLPEIHPEPVIEVPAKKSWPLPVWATALVILVFIGLVGAGGWAISRSLSATNATLLEKDQSPTEEELSIGVAPPTEDLPTEEVGDQTTEDLSSSNSENESGWVPLNFMIPVPQLWETSADGRYTAVGQASTDAFAWSEETVEGDVTVRLELESPASQSEGCIIIYGGGHQYSRGSLIFCIESEFFQLEKHSRYHEGENFLTYSQSNITFNNKVYPVIIEVKGDTASMYVDGEKVLSTFFDPAEFDRFGRIGLHKFGAGSEITFSNVEMQTLGENEQTEIASDDEWDCEIDANGQIYFYAIQSPLSTASVQVDGEISSAEEWSQAACVDLRMHYSINATNPTHHRIRWWVQNNQEDIFFLVRIPSNLATRGIFVDYFWPEYTGTWEYSDGIYTNIDGLVFDHCNWDEMDWHNDEELDPPGTIDVQAAKSMESEYYWFEIKRPLNSGDSYDWALEPGQVVGNNPYDSFLIGVVLNEGEFMRNLQLFLGEP